MEESQIRKDKANIVKKESLNQKNGFTMRHSLLEKLADICQSSQNIKTNVGMPTNQNSQQHHKLQTKRSDDSEFQDWLISTIKSGKFQFNKVTEPNSIPIEQIKSLKKIGLQGDTENQQRIRAQKKKTMNKRQITVHIQPQSSLQKTQKSPKLKTKSIKKLDSSQLAKKLIKQIFVHFCKENYISSIKSSLFQDKQKSMEQMTINKWMVFCKEFDILTKLCMLKINVKNKTVGQNQANLDGSRINDQRKVKQLKEVQKILISIFKKSSENMTKIQFPQFLTALKLLHEQFLKSYQNQDIKKLQQFMRLHLYCSNEQQCCNKLSNLKFTFGIPQIDYDGLKLATINSRIKSNSKLKAKQIKNHSKENVEVLKSQKTEPNLKSRIIVGEKSMTLNPVIQEAKDTLKTSNYPKSQIIQPHIKKVDKKTNLLLNQNKLRIKRPEKQKKSDLFKYLDSSKDDILQIFFQTQKNAKKHQKQK